MTLDPFHNFCASVSLCIKWDYNDVLVVSQLRVIVRRKFVQEKCSEENLAFPPELLAVTVHPQQPPARHVMQLVGGVQRAWAGAAPSLQISDDNHPLGPSRVHVPETAGGVRGSPFQSS